jgi:iron complex transport system substrate-binding protein
VASQISRRGFVGGGAAVAGLIPFAANAQESSPVASPAGTLGWSFTDDRGITSSFPETPTVLVAQTISAASLWDFGIEVDGVYGPIFLADGTTPDPNLANVDPSAVINFGEFGAFDIEKLAEIGGQLVIDIDRGGGMWYLSEEEQQLIGKIAQTVAISTTVPANITISRFQDLAVALGANPESDLIIEARTTYDAAAKAVQTVAASKPDLKVIVMTGTAENVYIVNPQTAGDLNTYVSLGVNVVVPENPDPAQLNVFETLSWEQAGKYPADVILWDSRFSPEGIVPETIWESLPAVSAGQVGTWESVFPNSWQGFSAVLEQLATTLESAEVLI